jgi:hypothetical protein
MHKIPAVESRQTTAMPAWAVLERQLIRAIEEAAPVYLEKYTHPNGELIWREGEQEDTTFADDLYESFFNWPHFYALGGSDYFRQMGERQWNATTRQLEFEYAQVTDEFVNAADWFHHGENYIYLYYLGWADPDHARMEQRARRFAGWYIGEDPRVPNYDPEFRIIPSPSTGGKGPERHFPLNLMTYHLGHGHSSFGPGFEVPKNWFEDEELTTRVQARFDQVVMREDIPLNLTATGLVTHAYLYTGEEKYRDWVVEYTEAWMERMEQNGGIVPDNVGLTGQIGENHQGQWWGGFYGWSCRFAPGIISTALAVAAQCAHLVTGDRRYLQFLRSHLDMLLDMSVEQDGQAMVPCRYTDDGWKDYGPLDVLEPIHLWATSMEERDWLRLERLRRGDEEAWDAVEPRGPRGPDDRNWVRFIAGDLPDYPEQILRANYTEVCRRLDLVMQDEEDQALVDEHHWQVRNPVVTEALAQLTTGGPQTMYWGGLAPGRVRYFDAQKRRPGLPEDIAALVTGLEEDSIDVTLVNLSPGRQRQVLIGAGSFGEHRFEAVEMVGVEGRVDVGGTYLQVNMRPASQLDLRLTMKRWCNKPSYAFPWHDLS